MEVRVVLAFAVDSWSPSETPPSPSCHIHTPQPSLHFSLLYLSIYTSFICLLITSPFLNKYPLRFWKILKLVPTKLFVWAGFQSTVLSTLEPTKYKSLAKTLPAGDFQCWNICDFHVSTIHGILAGNIQILVNPISSIVQDHVVSFQLSLIDKPVLSRYSSKPQACIRRFLPKTSSMNTRYPFPMNSFCGSSPVASPAGEEHGTVSLRNRSARTPTSSLLVRTAMRISRARWFTFLRRVFHYQNGSRSNLGSNPFNSSTWMMLEFVALVIQISITMFTLAISKAEKPVWPVRIWIIGYNIGCVLSLLLLYGRYRQINTTQADGFGLPDLEQQRGSEESRYFC